MIKTEVLTINGLEFIRTFSDAGLMIERDGVLYEEAIDPADTGRVYIESEPVDEEEQIAETEEAAEG